MPKETLRDRLIKKRERLETKGGGGNFFFPKNGTERYRILPTPPEKDWSVEMTTFYLGSGEDGGPRSLISPKTFGEPCAFMERYEKFKASKKEDDLDTIKKHKPRRKSVMMAIKYTDKEGSKVDHEAGPRLLQVPNSICQELIDLWTDDKEAGDFTDPKTGYDIKITRKGTGLTDTEYSVRPCKPTRLDKKYRDGTWDPEEELRKVIPTYEKTKEMADMVFGKLKSSKDKKKKKKSRK